MGVGSGRRSKIPNLLLFRLLCEPLSAANEICHMAPFADCVELSVPSVAGAQYFTLIAKGMLVVGCICNNALQKIIDALIALKSNLINWGRFNDA